MQNSMPRLFSISNLLLLGFLFAGDLAGLLFLLILGDISPFRLIGF